MLSSTPQDERSEIRYRSESIASDVLNPNIDQSTQIYDSGHRIQPESIPEDESSVLAGKSLYTETGNSGEFQLSGWLRK